MCRYAIILVFLMTFWSCTDIELPAFEPVAEVKEPVKTGAEVLLERLLPDLDGKSIGLVMNPTARVGNSHMLDTLLSNGVDIHALFAPEHGFRGDYGAGEKITDGVDEQTGLPVFSLYGQTRKPTPEMLEGIDVLLFDMQDVGARFYTYMSTMGLVMEAAAEQGVELWILDRPNPAGGDYVSGWMLDPKHTSFVGAYAVPIAHGMTLGELAMMIRDEGWLYASKPLNLRIVTMQGWERSMKWSDTGLEWVPPSPNLPTQEHAFVYLGTCLIEGTSMSEGRGTTDSFLLVGDPLLSIPQQVLDSLQQVHPIAMTDTVFTPIDIPGRAMDPKHENIQVQGIYLQPTARSWSELDPVAMGHDLLRVMIQSTDSVTTRDFLYLLTGTERIDEFLGNPKLSAAEMWEDEVAEFKRRRAPYLLYE